MLLLIRLSYHIQRAAFLPFPPSTILHFIHEVHEPVLLMAFVVFFRRPFGDRVGLLGKGEGSGRRREGKWINTAVGNVFIGNY